MDIEPNWRENLENTNRNLVWFSSDDGCPKWNSKMQYAEYVPTRPPHFAIGFLSVLPEELFF